MRRGNEKGGLARRLRSVVSALAVLALAVLALTVPASSAWAQTEEGGQNGDWAKRCNDQGQCIIQTGLTDDNGRLVGVLLLRRHPTDGLVGEIRSPLGLHIPSGVVASVDDAFSFKPILITCDQGSCLSAFRATDEVIGAMKKGGKLIATFVDIRTGKKVGLRFSLIGFTARFKEL